jgi:hypothetical protein
VSSFQSAVSLLPLASLASGMQNFLEWSDYEQHLKDQDVAAAMKTEVNQQISSTTSDGIPLKARQIGCELPDTTMIRLTPSQIRILGGAPATDTKAGSGRNSGPAERAA